MPGIARSDSATARPQVGRAGQAIENRRAAESLGRQGDAVRLEDPLDGLDAVGVEVGEQQVLLAGEADAGPEPGDDLVQRGLEPRGPRVSTIRPLWMNTP